MSSKKKPSEPTIDLVVDTLDKQKQALVFVNSKKRAEKTAEDIANALTSKVKSKELDALSEELRNALPRATTQCIRLAECCKKGVVFHHAGLVSKQRNLIEENFRNGMIKIICCTPTLCLSKDTKIWHNFCETEVYKFKISNPVFALSKNKLIKIKARKIQKNYNSSKLIEISSVSGYSIKVTPNHKMLIKRNNKKLIMAAKRINKNDKIAVIGRVDIKDQQSPSIKEFIIENKLKSLNYTFGANLSYFVGLLLGDGYSGAETTNGKVIYKGSPSIVGKDEEIFLHVEKVCKQLNIHCRRTKTSGGTPQLVLGKDKWFREFLVKSGVEKGERKHISEKIASSNLENNACILKGLFDTDGYVLKNSGIGISGISEKLIMQIKKMLLRFGIVSSLRKRKGSTMRIYGKDYKTKPCFELTIRQNKSILDFYRHICFGVKRKQDCLVDLVAKISSNLNYVSCKNCNYKIYRDLFSGRTKDQEKRGMVKLEVITLLGEKGELGSKKLKELLGKDPRNKETRLNHHYELIKKRRIGSRSNTEWFWSLNNIGRWVFENIISKKLSLTDFFKLGRCPICHNRLEWIIKKGWRDSDFEGDIFWDNIREVKEVECENEVYDVILPDKPENEHMIVANGFIVHNSLGVDLPAFRTIIKDLKRYSARGMNYIPVMEYNQISGRAGRPGKEKYGESIAEVSSKSEQETVIETYIKGLPEPILSKLAVEPVLRTYLLSLIATDFVNSKKQIFDFFGRTFWAYQFKDEKTIQKIILKMLKMLEENNFLKSSKKKGEDEFVSAAELEKEEKYDATPLGKRIAELYVDPLSAILMIEVMKKAIKKEFTEMTFLYMICKTLELRPILNVKISEYNKIQEKLAEHEDFLFEKFGEYNEDYDAYLSSFKTSLLLKDWIEEKDEEYILGEYNIRPGELNIKVSNSDWMLYSAEEIARILNFKSILAELKKLRMRMEYGAKEELLTLLKLKNVGRVRARKLYSKGFTDLGKLRKADIQDIASAVGKSISVSIKEQLGEKVKADNIKGEEEKKTGQHNLLDYS